MSEIKSVTVDAMNNTEGSQITVSQFTDNFDTVKFCIDPELAGYSLMIAAETEGRPTLIETDGTRLYTEFDEASGQHYLVWHPGREITCNDGLVVYQIIAYKTENGSIVSTWYSKEGRIIVTDSIDTTPYSTALIGSYPNLLTRLILETDTIRAFADGLNESKVDKIAGKELSANDFTDSYMKKLDEIEDKAEVNIIEKIKTDGVDIEIDSSDRSVNLELKSRFDEKVDKEDGMGLSQNNYTDHDAVKLSCIEYGAQVNLIEKITVDGAQVKVDAQSKTADIGLPVKNIGFIENINDLDSFNTPECSGIYTVYNNDYHMPSPHIVFVLPLGLSDYGSNLIDMQQIFVGMPSVLLGVRSYVHTSDTEASWTEITTLGSIINDYVRPKPKTAIPSVLIRNTSYNFGEISEKLTLKFQNGASDGDVIYVTFKTPASGGAEVVINTDNTCDVDMVAEPDTGYEIFAKYNGSIWIVSYSEYTV